MTTEINNVWILIGSHDQFVRGGVLLANVDGWSMVKENGRDHPFVVEAKNVFVRLEDAQAVSIENTRRCEAEMQAKRDRSANPCPPPTPGRHRRGSRRDHSTGGDSRRGHTRE